MNSIQFYLPIHSEIVYERMFDSRTEFCVKNLACNLSVPPMKNTAFKFLGIAGLVQLNQIMFYILFFNISVDYEK